MVMSATSKSYPHVIDAAVVPERSGSVYPEHLSAPLKGRFRRGLGSRVGVRNFGVNLLRLAPGAWSSQRHAHDRQDELIYVLEGEVVLVTDEGERVLGTGMVAGFPAGSANAHHLINRGAQDALVLEVGDRSAGDAVTYADVDMAAKMAPPSYAFTQKDGTPY